MGGHVGSWRAELRKREQRKRDHLCMINVSCENKSTHGNSCCKHFSQLVKSRDKIPKLMIQDSLMEHVKDYDAYHKICEELGIK